jgi:hypothetical protein
MERHRASRFVRRADQAVERHPEGRRSVARQEPRCSAGFRDAAAVLRLEVRRQRAAPALRQGQHEPARRGVPGADPYPARLSAAAARKVRALRATEALGAQRLAQAERLAPPALLAAEASAVQEAQQVLRVAAAQPRAVPEVWDVAVVQRPAAEPAGAVRRLEVAAVQDVAAAAPWLAAGPASAAGRLRAAGVLDAAVQRRAARDAQGVLLSAAAWAVLPWIRQGDLLGPSARVAHARRQLPTARP